VRELHARKKKQPLWPLAKARANKTAIDWAHYTPPVPKFIGRRVFKNIDLAELVRFIDWGRSSRPGTWPAPSPPSSATRWWAPRPRASTPTRKPC
jgi:hypothetical protein